MRKLLSLFLVILFLMSMTYPALAYSYKETALTYLMKKYNVAEEKIQLYEGVITELEFTAESFWLAKYIIYTGEKPSSGTIKGEKPQQQPLAEPMTLPAPDSMRLPTAQPMPMPAPDMPSDNKQAVMPLPPQDSAGVSDIYGGIYLRIKTGEILEMDKAEAYFATENRLAQQEWERLRKEAGKLDVSLYRKLKGLPVTEKVNVSIQPTPVETDDIKAKFADLKKKYPELTSGMELMNILPYGYAIDESSGGGVSSSTGSSGYAVPAGDTVVSYTVPDNQSKIAPPSAKPDIKDLPAVPNINFRGEYSAMWGEVEQIRQQAIMPSLTDLKKALDGMGVTYQDNKVSCAAKLTASQIDNIVRLSSVSAVFEEGTFSTMDAKEISARTSANDTMIYAPMEAKDVKSSYSYFPLILITAALIIALIINRHHISRIERK